MVQASNSCYNPKEITKKNVANWAVLVMHDLPPLQSSSDLSCIEKITFNFIG